MILRPTAQEVKRPNAYVLILLVLLPVLAVATTIDNVTAACTCPHGGTYRSSIYTSLCGWQYNVCVSFDYNCGNDYPAVCGTTTTRTTSTRSTTIRSTTTSRTITSTTTRSTTTIRTGTSCGYIEIMMGQCGQGQPYAQPRTTITTTGTTRMTQTNVMVTAPRLQLYTVTLILKPQPPQVAGWVAGWRVYVDGNVVGITDSQGTLKFTVTGGSHHLILEKYFGYTVNVTSEFYANSDGQVVTVTVNWA